MQEILTGSTGDTHEQNSELDIISSARSRLRPPPRRGSQLCVRCAVKIQQKLLTLVVIININDTAHKPQEKPRIAYKA